MTGPGPLQRSGPIAVAVLMALAVVVGWAAFGYNHRYSTRVNVPIRATGSAADPGWTLGSRAVLASDGGGPSLVLVEATRHTPAREAPQLVTEFDGSGGGEALVVDCTSDPGTPWTAAPGGSEWLVLRCDRFVEPFALRGFAWIQVGSRSASSHPASNTYSRVDVGGP